jgi:hypothetical protein
MEEVFGKYINAIAPKWARRSVDLPLVRFNGGKFIKKGWLTPELG